MIEDLDGIPAAQQRLFHDHEPLEDDNTLGHYNIKTGATIKLALNLRGGDDGGGGGGGSYGRTVRGGGGGGGSNGAGRDRDVSIPKPPRPSVEVPTNNKQSVFIKDGFDDVAMILQVRALRGGGRDRVEEGGSTSTLVSPALLDTPCWEGALTTPAGGHVTS